MRIAIFLTILLIPYCSYSQDSIPIRKIDTLIPFFGRNSLRLHGYENRVIPFNSVNPLHVLVTFKESKKTNFEYFRQDSITYLVYEYFRDGKISSNDGVKSKGIKIVKDKIIDSSRSTIIYAGRSEDRYAQEIHYFREFSKEGEWEEYEDSIFHHTYWTGNYKDNKKIGLWKHVIYGIGDEFTIEEIDYDKDSTKKVFSNNILKTVHLDSIKKLIAGTWHLRSCDSEKDFRMFYIKCKAEEDSTGYSCDNYFDMQNYYDFDPSSKFIRQRGDGCYKFRETSTSGKWKLIERNGNWFIEVKFSNSQIWILKLLYIDNDLNIITDRVKNYGYIRFAARLAGHWNNGHFIVGGLHLG